MGFCYPGLVPYEYRDPQTHRYVPTLMPDFIIQGLLCDLSIVLLVGLFDGIDREFTRRTEIARREDLIRRGYIL